MHWQWPAMTAAFLAVAANVLPYKTDESQTNDGTCFVTTDYGDVQGVKQGAACAFLGIPYAAPPTGANRWRPPQPAHPWAPLVKSATTAPASCTASEDCLMLNIWVSDPAPESPAPVIIWLHTGAFVAASANFASSNGRRLAEETGVIVVAPNYRLGPFGFLAHAALEAEDAGHPSTGNYGLLDQRAAMAWVRDNIAQFGGDPERVTIAGTSAGGQSVGLHLVSPGSAGLFAGAIVQSAYPTTRWSTREEALAQGDDLARTLECTDAATVLTCLRSKTREQVSLALIGGSQPVVEPVGRAFWEPFVDGLVIPDQPRTLFEQGEFTHVPVIVGTTRDEGWGNFITRSFPAPVTLAQYEAWVGTEFGEHAPTILAQYPAANFASPQEAMARVVGDGLFRCEAVRLADLIADGGLRGRGPHEDQGTGQRIKMPVYLYSYEYELDDLSLDHVIHGVESNIIFGNGYTVPNFAANHPLNATDLALHDAMAGYWTRFAANGNPNMDQVLEWPVYQKNHESRIVFDATVSADLEHKDESCAFWQQFSFRSMLVGLPAWQ